MVMDAQDQCNDVIIVTLCELSLQVAGWGGINKPNADVLDEPQKVHVPIVSTKECRASLSAFHTLTSDKTMCAGRHQ